MDYQKDLFDDNEKNLDEEWEKAGKLICKYPDCNGKCICSQSDGKLTKALAKSILKSLG